jgi:hypothetical protein
MSRRKKAAAAKSIWRKPSKRWDAREDRLRLKPFSISTMRARGAQVFGNSAAKYHWDPVELSRGGIIFVL